MYLLFINFVSKLLQKKKNSKTKIVRHGYAHLINHFIKPFVVSVCNSFSNFTLICD